jgi:hypothetical protein
VNFTPKGEHSPPTTPRHKPIHRMMLKNNR